MFRSHSMFFSVLVFFALLITSFHSVAANTLSIIGAGATFPYPIYAKWAKEYQQATGVQLNYQAIGSGGGIKQIKAKTIDFGASDLPLTSLELTNSELTQFPTVIGAIVPVVNLAGIPNGQLKLSGQLLADIFLGKIKKWNDPSIIALNPTLNLPDQAIIVVHRSDGSGTTFLFTHYLSDISADWKKQVGSDPAVSWPVGVGGKGNEGVAAYVQRIKGAIGYVEFAYAKQNQLNYTQLQNKAGQFVTPSAATFRSAAQNANWENAPNFAEILTNQPGATSWPITGATFILIHTEQANVEKAKAILQFFDWAFRNGGEMALALDYIPLPMNVIELIEKSWKKTIKDESANPIWPITQ